MTTTELREKKFLPAELNKKRHNTTPAPYRKKKENKNRYAFVVDWQIPEEEF